MNVPLQEFENRIGATRKLMRQRGLEALVAYSNTKLSGHTKYLSNYAPGFAGYCSLDPATNSLFGSAIVMVPIETDPVLITDVYWDEQARESSTIKDVRNSIDYARELTQVIKKAKISGKIGVAGWDIFPAPLYARLTKMFPGIEFCPSTILEELRMVKSPYEIDLLRTAAKITSKGLRAGLAALEPGKTESEVALVTETAIRSGGAEDLAMKTILASGLRTLYGGPLPSEKKIEGTDIVMIDVGAKYLGYCGDITRCKVCGKASPEQTNLFEAVKQMQAEALDAVKPGVKASDVDLVPKKVARELGYDEKHVFPLTGHGVGLEIHERPDFGREETRLVPGVVITIEPGLVIPHLGAIRIEDTVLVTESGIEILTECEKTL